MLGVVSTALPVVTGLGALDDLAGAAKAGKEALSALIKDATTNSGGWRTVGAFTEAATNKAAKGGVSVQEVVESGAGDQLIRHTVVDKAGNAVDGPHYRPNYKPRDVDQP